MCRSHVSTAEPCDLEERESAPNNPEIESDHWFDRGTALLAGVYQDQAAGLIGPHPDKAVLPAVHWLWQHPRCDVALRSEYGDTREIAGVRDA